MHCAERGEERVGKEERKDQLNPTCVCVCVWGREDRRGALYDTQERVGKQGKAGILYIPTAFLILTGSGANKKVKKVKCRNEWPQNRNKGQVLTSRLRPIH
jgi:hypothetical protein